MSKPVFLAGTRLTGDKMHIGTYYGWIYQIKKAQTLYDPIVIISDFQSLDYEYSKSYYEEAQILKQSIQHFLPDVPVIIESDIENIVRLGIYILGITKKRYYKRIMPIRKHIEENTSINFPMLLYPSLMVADVLALDAKCIFNKPEGKFQHSEILNCILHDLNVQFDFHYPKLNIFEKDIINILSLDGTGPMKRNRKDNGVLEIENVSYNYLYETLMSSSTNTLTSIATSLKCGEDITDGKSLAEVLAKRIYTDISNVPSVTYEAQSKYEHEIINSANARVNQMLEILTNLHV